MTKQPRESEQDAGWRGLDDHIELDEDWQGWIDLELAEWFPDDWDDWLMGDVLICMLCGLSECACSHFYCIVCGWSIEAPTSPSSVVVVCRDCELRVGD